MNGDDNALFPNLPPRFAGRIRVNARNAPTPERAPIVQPPQSSWEALRDAYLAAPLAGLGAIGQGVNWGMDALTRYAAAQGATPLGALAPNWHPLYGREDVPGVAERLTNLANDPVPFGLPNPEALAPKLGVAMAAAGPLAAKAAKGATAAEDVAKGALPRVAWDAEQQRWIAQEGKKAGQPITSSPLDIPTGGPSYPNLFDPSDPALAQRPEGAAQFDLPRGSMVKGPAVSPRVADLIANQDVRSQVLDYARNGLQMGGGVGQRWYNTSPILDSAVRALGPEDGPTAYQKYIGFTGATSPQQKVPPNLRTASYYYWRDANGLPPMEIGEKGIPPLYGHYVQRLHQQNVKDFIDSGYDPLAAYDSAENPKPPSFNQGLLGNYSPVAVDMHAFKLPAMLSRDPRFLATGGVQGMPDFNPREAVTSGQVSMDEAFKNPTWWESAPNPKNEYPALEKYWKGIASDLGVEPAQGQAGGWIGGGGVTGLGSPPETAAQSFQQRIFNTAYRTGQTPAEAERGFWTGAHPLLGLGAPFAAAPMLQQYWNAQQPPGATDQPAAPAPSQFY